MSSKSNPSPRLIGHTGFAFFCLHMFPQGFRSRDAVFQMFHMMPKVAGREFLQDRVFHVLVVTTQTKHAESPGELARTFTVQLPVDFESFGNGIMAQRSHVKKIGSSRTYQVPQGQESCSFKPDVQRSRQGRKLTEGKYVAFERLTGAPKKPPSDTGNTGHHRWDMVCFMHKLFANMALI